MQIHPNVRIPRAPNAKTSTIPRGGLPAYANCRAHKHGHNNNNTGGGGNKYDIILGADCVASIYSSEALAKTIQDLAKDNSHVFLTIRDRLAGSIEDFEERLERIFILVERIKPTSSNKNPGVWLLHATGKRQDQ